MGAARKLIAASVIPLEVIRGICRDLGDQEAMGPGLFFRAPVCNPAAQDFHACCVSGHGIRVHD